MVDVVAAEMGLAEQEQRLLSLLTDRVHRVFASAQERGVPADAFGDLDAVADAMSAALPVGHLYDQVVGPFYDSAGLARWWGVSRQAISKKVAARGLICCPLEDGSWVYPTWQFTTAGGVHLGMLQVWRVLRAHGDAWTCALWMCSAADDEVGSSAVERLQRCEPVQPLVDAAAADAAGWAA